MYIFALDFALDRESSHYLGPKITGSEMACTLQGWTQRGRLRGGALQAEDLFRAVQAVSGVRKPLLIGGGSGVAPPGNFLKSISLRMHFRPF